VPSSVADGLFQKERTPTMLTSIHIQGFKGFKDTHIAPLRKVNLILGGQNVGKTSLLEAVYLGASPIGNVQGLPGVFRLAEGHDSQRFLDMTFKSIKGAIELEFELDKFLKNVLYKGERASCVTEINLKELSSFNKSYVGALSFDNFQLRRALQSSHLNLLNNGSPWSPETLTQPPLAISVNLPTQAEAVRLLDQVVLKRKKRILLEALRRIEPRLEDIHSLSPDGEQRVYLELDGLDTAVPLPQLGHGFSRLLHLYCSLLVTDAKLALMDEVENGIHYASLPILFQGVHDMASTQGVQTLMTTHSWDCIRAAYKTFADADALQDFQLIRLEREGDNVRAVVINGDMLDTVMEAGYEVR
jgi:hypothetical protein